MIELLKAVIYGIVQGLTEFLPVSSSAHLIITSKIFAEAKMSVGFEVALHVGTAIAVVVFFFKDWVRLISAGIKNPKSSDGKMFWYIAAASIPTGALCLLLDKLMPKDTSLYIIAAALIVLGIVLYYADKVCPKKTDEQHIGFKNSILIGVSQVIAAVIPGTSRSGITITAGRLLGIKREAVARFTFLLSTPVIVAAGLYKFKDITQSDTGVLPIIIAVAVSAAVGMLCIKFMLTYIRKKGFGIFAIYRIALGLLIIVLTMAGVFPQVVTLS